MTASKRILQIDPATAEALAAYGAVFLDVREPDEWDAGHIPQALHMPLGCLDMGALPKDRIVIAVCRSGNRSGKAAATLVDAGFDVCNLAGGMKVWANDGHPITSSDGHPGDVA
ncbi:MAG: hypothetical protein ABS81_04490 [Pseudonocardia sp. SCN 72-86]|nr:MAG: hypothetical protein ABS81_04490 [Pseudonocardia sp. SCN 72-86]ODU29317.1 MAG: hypothetical protein ABS80_01835 [Pseudonocardia sp. SCN 72-51]